MNKLVGIATLAVGFAMAVSMAADRSGTSVIDVATLTQITGAGCARVQTQSCWTIGCDTCNAYAAGGTLNGKTSGDKDCSSSEDYTCGTCKDVTSCGG